MNSYRLNEAPLDEVCVVYALIKTAERRKDRNGKDYLALTFQDKSGLLDGKLWGVDAEALARYKPGLVVCLQGKRELFNQTPQFRIHSLRPAEEGEPREAKLYTQTAPLSEDEMALEIEAALLEITNSSIEKLVRYLLKQAGPAFYAYPAAKRMHHTYYGGLAFHTVSILKMARAVCSNYPNINKNLLFGGLILHDLGKLLEYRDPLNAEYTLRGNLMGHISLMNEALALACNDLHIPQDEEAVVLLKHMILSHHGKLEYGSPVEPKILEAEILHRLDDLDASVQMVQAVLEQTEPGEFSQRVTGMEGRNFYKPK